MIDVINIGHRPAVIDGATYIYIGRTNITYGLPGSLLANPERLPRGCAEEFRANAIQRYKRRLWKLMQSDTEVQRELLRLAAIARERDLYLCCWCAPEACHGDVVKAAIEWILSTIGPVQEAGEK